MRTVYFDNAATSFPKPPSVILEVGKCITRYCGNPGRSSHPLAMAAADKIYDCRERLCDFFSASSPSRVVFAENATHALNIAIKGLLHRGDHVLLSDMEHNAVLRPIVALCGTGDITYDIFETHRDGRLLSSDEICGGISSLIRRGQTRMLICSHIPNVCSSILPVAEIGTLCRRNGIIFLLDASQSAGHIPIDMAHDHIDVLCAPGHKGLLGIQGCGFMIISEDLTPDTLMEGGSGVDSLSPSMPGELPERLEAGTLPTPSIVGLSEGVRYLTELSPNVVHERERMLFRRLRDMLKSTESLNAEIYAEESEGAVMLFNLKGHSSEEVGRHLSKRGICVRSGYHCAPLGHRTLGTPDGGAVRVSFGLFNQTGELDPLLKALKEYVRQK